MTAALVALLLAPQQVSYEELSKKLNLGGADRLMREGKYLEAAVAYRNVLLQPGDHEAVRIPFAIALFMHGDPAYAGTELRRAQSLAADFGRLKINLADLVGTRVVQARLRDADAVRERDGDAEAHGARAYLFALLGDGDAAKAALERYTTSRGEDPFARDLKALIERSRPKPGPPVAAAGPGQPAGRATTVVSSANAGNPRAGSPARAGVRFAEPAVRPCPDVFLK